MVDTTGARLHMMHTGASRVTFLPYLFVIVRADGLISVAEDSSRVFSKDTSLS